MCIKRRRKKSANKFHPSLRSDRTTPARDGGAGTPTESSRNALRTAEETKTTTEIKVQTFSQMTMSQQNQKQSSMTTSQQTNNTFEQSQKNPNPFNGDDNEMATAAAGGGGGGDKTITVENDVGGPAQFGGGGGTTPTRSIEQQSKFEKKEIGNEKKQQQQPNQQPQYQQQQQLPPQSPHTNTQEDIKLDKTQDIPAESPPIATAATPQNQATKILQTPPKPLQNLNNNNNSNDEKPKPQQNLQQPKQHRKRTTPFGGGATTDYKATTTPLLTDVMHKKVEKENFQELSRIPKIETANIKHERFPYSNQDHQDTMAGMSSNFSGTIETPTRTREAYIHNVDQEIRNKRTAASVSSKKKTTKKKTKDEDDPTQESSKKNKQKR